MLRFWCVIGVLAIASMSLADGIELTLQLPPETKVSSAVASAPSMKLETKGQITGQTIVFPSLLPQTPYDLQVTLADGTRLCGVDLSWYNDDPAKTDAGQMSDDDRKQINALASDIKQFYDKSEILLLHGDHDRAVALVQQIRNSAFHSGKAGEVIWRIEVWYFRFRHGGWERISQTNKVLRRERFDQAKYEAETSKLRWAAQLGGIVLTKQAKQTMSIGSEVIDFKGPATQPFERPAASKPVEPPEEEP